MPRSPLPERSIRREKWKIEMYYTVRHVTRFRYSAPISESIMEVRLQPRSEGLQRCLDFRLSTSPRTQILNYRGENNNRVHHFDVPNLHSSLTITAESIVEVLAPQPIPDSLLPTAWDELDAMADAHPFSIGDADALIARVARLKGWGFVAQALPDL